VDITVLDDGGNIIDCASIATITALSHFRFVFVYFNDYLLANTVRKTIFRGIWGNVHPPG
jgi:exosome complex RNA-binding protein Rrp42 (RNase PH superfamily)